MALLDRIKKEEGYRGKMYKDSEGIWTIGYGFNLEANAIPEPIATMLAQYELEISKKEMLDHLPWIATLDPIRQDVFEDMTFNMGIYRLLEFHHMLAFAKTGDFPNAKLAGLNSLWAKQTGHRATQLMEQLATGVEQEY